MDIRRKAVRARAQRIGAACGAALLCLAFAGLERVHAAGGAYAVDDAGVDAPGACKVETFASFARNDDFMAVVAPACVVSLGGPVELGLQVDRSRSGGEWGTGGSLKAKTAIIPFDGPFGLAISGGAGFDLIGREASELFFNVPVSFKLAEPLTINLNIGGLRDLIDQRSFLTWGAGFELALAERLTVLGEVFGDHTNRPGAQIGLRFTPHERIDFDVIYGRNLTGERADWITFGVNLRN